MSLYRPARYCRLGALSCRNELAEFCGLRLVGHSEPFETHVVVATLPYAPVRAPQPHPPSAQFMISVNCHCFDCCPIRPTCVEIQSHRYPGPRLRFNESHGLDVFRILECSSHRESRESQINYLRQGAKRHVGCTAANFQVV